MESACDKCAKPVKADEESITCMGFCEQVTHAKCAKLNSPFLKNINERKNLFWLCDECVKLMKMTRFKSSFSSVGCAVSSILDCHERAINDLKQAISNSGKQMEQLSKKVQDTVSTPSTSRISTGEPPQKRRRDERIKITNPLLGGTKPSTSCSVSTVPPPKELFWLYLSRIHPSVTTDAINNLAKECLQCDEAFKVIPLVRKDAVLNEMSFISFKVGMDKQLRDSALNPGTWPRGILFREFEGSGIKNYWTPPETHPSPRITLTPATNFLSPNVEPGLAQMELS